MKTPTIRPVLRPRAIAAIASLAVIFGIVSPAMALTFSDDTAAPTVPSAVTVVNGELTAAVSWAASTDNVGTLGYELWRDGSLLTTTGKTSYTDNNTLPGATYQYSVRSFDASGNYSALSAATGFTAAAASFWEQNYTPQNIDSNDTSPGELGMRFTPLTNGQVTGVSFYKAATNTGTHTGRLWTVGGALLGSVTFSGETASGWQTAQFSAPISVTANTSYVISYSAPAGHYSYSAYYFTSRLTNPYLEAPASSGATLNGVFATSVGAFPNNAFNANNYWVDVLFAPSATAAPLGTNQPTNSTTSLLSPGPSSITANILPAGGDGWQAIPYKNKVYNVAHHVDSSDTNIVGSRDIATGAAATGYPRSLDNGTAAPVPLQTILQDTEYVDRLGQYGAVGNMYVPAQARTTGGNLWIICFNLESGNNCGHTNVGISSVGGSYAAGGALREVAGKLYVSNDRGQILGMDLATDAAIAPVSLGFPSSALLNGGNRQTSPQQYKINDKLIVVMRYNAQAGLESNGAQFQCYDPSTGAICAGWSATPATFTGTVGSSDKAMLGSIPMLDSVGNEIGFCTYWVNNVSSTKGADCYDINGNAQSTPAALIAPADAPNYLFDSATLPGTGRVYIPLLQQGSPVVDTYHCFDWATQANCSDFGDTPGSIKTWSTVNNSNLATYTIVRDPDNASCLWSLGDNGFLISFSAYTGDAPCTVAQYSGTIAPARAYCDGVSRITAWQNVLLHDITSNQINTATITIKDKNGTVLSGYNNVAIAPGSPIDLSSIAVSSPTDELSFTMNFDFVRSRQLITPKITTAFSGGIINQEASPCTTTHAKTAAWQDTNGNGIKESGEPIFPNVQAKLISQSWFTVASGITDSQGNITFGPLAPGDYAVQFTTPQGFVLTRQVAGTGLGDSSDPDLVSQLTRFVTLAAGSTSYVLAAGFTDSALLNNSNTPTSALANTGSDAALLLLGLFLLVLGAVVAYVKYRAPKRSDP